MKGDVNRFKAEMDAELDSILDYWGGPAVDHQYGGFVGRIDNANQVHPQSPKGSVLNARILWTFSSAYTHHQNPRYLEMADRAFSYLVRHFLDTEQGGVYWTVDYQGNPLDTKKQMYALAFTLYGLAAYEKCRHSGEAKRIAVELFSTIVEKSYDTRHGGYFEAFDRHWGPLEEVRLSDKDENEKKTMNTHLHILEAFSALYQIWPDVSVRERIAELIEVFQQYMITPGGHLGLFFNEQWRLKPGLYSYGHDIEASWLVPEAAGTIGWGAGMEPLKDLTLRLVQASLEGLDTDGGLWYEYDLNHHRLVREKHWWVQAEAMVGFLNAWQMTGEERFLKISMDNWEFVKTYIREPAIGEWRWGVDQQHLPMPGEDKVGLWKCPYHNGRACLEIIKRLNNPDGFSRSLY